MNARSESAVREPDSSARPRLVRETIVGTANHYWLDAMVVCALLAVAFAALRLPRAAPAPTHRPWPVADAAAAGAPRHPARVPAPVGPPVPAARTATGAGR